jgi:hypothetical protein
MNTCVQRLFNRFLNMGILTNQFGRCAPDDERDLFPSIMEERIDGIHENHVFRCNLIIIGP